MYKVHAKPELLSYTTQVSQNGTKAVQVEQQMHIRHATLLVMSDKAIQILPRQNEQVF